jgi:hypothetical protein
MHPKIEERSEFMRKHYIPQDVDLSFENFEAIRSPEYSNIEKLNSRQIQMMGIIWKWNFHRMQDRSSFRYSIRNQRNTDYK